MKEKIIIKRWDTKDIIFEYEKENNTIKSTLLEAIKNDINLRNANLEGANLEYANLCNANLEGAYLYIWDGKNGKLINEIIINFEKNSNIRIKKYYINKYIKPTISSFCWENGLIIDEYEIIEDNSKIEKLNWEYVNTYGNKSVHKKSEEDIINKINEIIDVLNEIPELKINSK